LDKEFIRVNTEGFTEYGVIYLTKYLKNPLTISELRVVPIVKEASFLKSGPAVSVFPITNEQGKIILDILFERNTYLINEIDDSIIEKYGEINVSDSPVVSEGNLKLVKHLYRERNQKIIKLKKNYVLRSKGKLDCEVCGFNFENNYGLLGKEFCEVHHKNAIANYDGEDITTIDDLAILCSNCHRMLHKTFPLMDVLEFKKMLEKRS